MRTVTNIYKLNNYFKKIKKQTGDSDYVSVLCNNTLKLYNDYTDKDKRLFCGSMNTGHITSLEIFSILRHIIILVTT